MYIQKLLRHFGKCATILQEKRCCWIKDAAINMHKQIEPFPQAVVRLFSSIFNSRKEMRREHFINASVLLSSLWSLRTNVCADNIKADVLLVYKTRFTEVRKPYKSRNTQRPESHVAFTRLNYLSNLFLTPFLNHSSFQWNF